ncbi:MAG TPA: NAD(P)-binding domain-containing protein [Vicinamibacterales bacterium]
MSTIGFIGGGRVTRILVGGWLRAGSFPHTLRVAEPDDAAFSALARGSSAVERVALERAAGADLVMLALHPPQIGAVLPRLAAVLPPGATLLSLAPKITLEQLSAGARTARVARMIPNAPSLVGRGYNPVTFGPGLDESARTTIATLFAPLGSIPQVPESHLEAYAILSGMGPTYFWPQFEALREVAGQLGLPAGQAAAGLRATIEGTIATLLDAGLTPAEVMDLVPVKPLGDHEAAIVAMYHDRLPALHAKIAPAPALATTQQQG